MGEIIVKILRKVIGFWYICGYFVNEITVEIKYEKLFSENVGIVGGCNVLCYSTFVMLDTGGKCV